MRRSLAVAILAILSAVPISLLAQQPQSPPAAPTRDQQAVAVLQQSVAAMGRTLPSDSVATGTVELIAGSADDTGTIRISTRGTDQSSESITIAGKNMSIVYSRGNSAQVIDGVKKQLPLELAVVSQSEAFPLVLVSRDLSDPKVAIQYIGIESIGSTRAHHIRTKYVGFTDARAQHLNEFSARDYWIDVDSGLLRQVSHISRPTKDTPPQFQFATTYGDYRSVGGILYPYSIIRTLNTIVIQKVIIQEVAVNTSLTDAEFSLR
jgi:hypothetical protein